MANPHPNASSLDTNDLRRMGGRDRLPGQIRHTILKPGQRMPQVSSKGRFRSSTGKITRPRPQKDGCVSIRIFQFLYRMHSLVTCAFHGLAPSLQYKANHKDRDPSNNNADNLEWRGKSEQAHHSRDTKAGRRSNAAQQSKAVKATRVDDSGAEQETLCFPSEREAGRVLGVASSTISACCLGKRKTTSGNDGRQLWSFCFDTDAAQPALLNGEEWKDVVAGNGVNEVNVVKGGQTEGQVDITRAREELDKRGLTWPRVSSLGRFQDSFGIIKVPIPDADGYVRVQVFGSRYRLHGLVARAFEGKVPPGHGVDHIDRNPSNNALANLRYLPPLQLQQVAELYAPDRESNAGRCRKAIKATRVGGDSGVEQETLCFASQHEAASELQVKQGHISSCCLGKRKTLCGKDGRRWSFCFDTEVGGEPEHIEGEEWRDVVMAPAPAAAQ